MKKVSDIVAEFLANHPHAANSVFMVSGGGNMHLIDSLGRNEKLAYICNHHEQACTLAAEGYARATNKIGLAMVTTGPGGTNAITGVYSAWVDSIPTLTISGQVKFETTVASQPELNLRQLGDQEVNIVDLVKPVTKYAVMVTDKNQILYHLEKAVYEAKHGRPGPVWIDIPLDIQGAMVDETTLSHFTFPAPPSYNTKIDEVIDALQKAERPVIIAGNGLRLSDAIHEFHLLVEQLKIPVLTSISGIDVIESNHPLFFGRPGILGERAANFIVQNSDLVLVLGTRLNLRVLSFEWQYFARDAFKVMVDIDINELEKKTFKPDIKIHADLKVFLADFLRQIPSFPPLEPWLAYCNQCKQDYPLPDKLIPKPKQFISSYILPKLLSHVDKHHTIVTGNGTAYTSTYQVYEVRANDRIFANVGCASMGYDLPAAIGASVAKEKKEVICITGDGSIQMNIQELQTIMHYRLPVKIFMYNNQGYLSIRLTQQKYFSGQLTGEGNSSGVSIPNMSKLAEVYGFSVYSIDTERTLQEKLPEILNHPDPVFCELFLDPNEILGPKVSSLKKEDGSMISKPLEDLEPFLPRDEFNSHMIIEPIAE